MRRKFKSGEREIETTKIDQSTSRHVAADDVITPSLLPLLQAAVWNSLNNQAFFLEQTTSFSFFHSKSSPLYLDRNKAFSTLPDNTILETLFHSVTFIGSSSIASARCNVNISISIIKKNRQTHTGHFTHQGITSPAPAPPPLLTQRFNENAAETCGNNGYWIESGVKWESETKKNRLQLSIRRWWQVRQQMCNKKPTPPLPPATNLWT